MQTARLIRICHRSLIGGDTIYIYECQGGPRMADYNGYVSRSVCLLPVDKCVKSQVSKAAHTWFQNPYELFYLFGSRRSFSLSIFEMEG